MFVGETKDLRKCQTNFILCERFVSSIVQDGGNSAVDMQLAGMDGNIAHFAYM